MQRTLLLSLCLLAAACAPLGKAKKEAGLSDNYAEVRDADCYTVDLFDKFEIQNPGPDVPANYAAFLGDWGRGAWNGKWCHDLLILRVDANGSVDMLDMHAPNESLNQPPTVFRRKGFIDLNGTLRFAYGKERRVYWIDRNYLVGTRTGNLGQFKIAMTRKDLVPSPVARPAKLASLD
ncbi:hypothetical protein KHP62_04980 [Rhodobacteraceae bacterium NNCM2]|nr:hypothetical protein [Coraliihabitans acroporae]